MNKTILITGASSGIGKATALLFQEKGWNVIATMRTPEKETELSKLENVLVTRLDVLDLASIDAAIRAGIGRFGKIDALMNNAGYGAYGPLEVFPRENMLRQFDTNVIGLLDVSRAIIPHFRENGAGVLLNVSSVGGRTTFPLGTLYHGTKWAVEGISEALSYELAALGIRVRIIEPGFIATDFGGRSFDFQNDESITGYQPVVAATMAAFQASRPSPATLVAEAVYEACTDDSARLRYIAGSDAEQLLDTRQQMGEEAFLAMMRERYGFE